MKQTKNFLHIHTTYTHYSSSFLLALTHAKHSHLSALDPMEPSIVVFGSISLDLLIQVSSSPDVSVFEKLYFPEKKKPAKELIKNKC